CITVTRGTAVGRFEVYVGVVQKRLPRIRLPLSASDKDGTLDLQDVFRRAYDQCNLGETIDYHEPLPKEGQWTDSVRDWFEEWLRKAEFRH
ncbi:MAG: DUF4058 family protein, partial [Gemmataceae bacterium]